MAQKLAQPVSAQSGPVKGPTTIKPGGLEGVTAVVETGQTTGQPAAPEKKGPVDVAQRDQVIEQATVASDVASPTEALTIVANASSENQDQQPVAAAQSQQPVETDQPVQSAASPAEAESGQAAGTATAVNPSEGQAVTSATAEAQAVAAAENQAKPRTVEEILADPNERRNLFKLTEEDAFRQIARLLKVQADSRGDTLTDEQLQQLDQQAVDRYFDIHADEHLRVSGGEVTQKVLQESLFMQKTREARKALVDKAIADGKTADDVSQSEVHRRALADYLKARYEITTAMLNPDGTIKNEKAFLTEISQRIVDNRREAQQNPIERKQLEAIVWQERASLLAQAYHRRGEGLPSHIINDKRWEQTRGLVGKTQMQFAQAHGIDSNNPAWRSMVEQQALEKYFLEEEKETFLSLLAKILKELGLGAGIIVVGELKDQFEAVAVGK